MTNENNKPNFTFDNFKQAAEDIRGRAGGETLALATGTYKVHPLSSQDTRLLLDRYKDPLTALLEGKTTGGSPLGVRDLIATVISDVPALSSTLIDKGSDADLTKINTDAAMVLAGSILWLTFIAPAAAFSFFGAGPRSAQPESATSTPGTDSKPHSEARS